MAIAIGAVGTREGSAVVHTRRGGVYQVLDGMPVVGANGGQVGRVKGVGDTTVLVDRALQRDVYVPFDAIAGVAHGALVLTILKEQVDGMHWLHPSLF